MSISLQKIEQPEKGLKPQLMLQIMISIDEDFNIDKEIEDDGNSTSVCSQKRKKLSILDVPSLKRSGGSSGALISIISDMVSSIREYMQSSNQKVDVDEAYIEVFMVYDLDED